MGSRVDITTLSAMKQRGEPITMLTCYDYPTACFQDAAGVDLIFVGDSVGTNVLGYENPQQVTMEDMIHHTRAVRRGVKEALFVSDLPYASYETPEQGLENAVRLADAGAEVVKLEGGQEVADRVAKIVAQGIPIMGHIGFTPQTAGSGSPVVGSRADEAMTLYNSVRALEDAGACAVVLECVPERVAEIITKAFKIPTIGIGSGRSCDGQVLVTPDLLGMSTKELRFAKRYAELSKLVQNAFSDFVTDVKERKFPGDEHRFLIKREELRKFRESIGA